VDISAKRKRAGAARSRVTPAKRAFGERNVGARERSAKARVPAPFTLGIALA
jgi:hypothetical protein